MFGNDKKFIRNGKFKVSKDIERVAYEKTMEEYEALSKCGRSIKDECVMDAVSFHLMGFVIPDVTKAVMSFECAYAGSQDMRDGYARDALDKVKLGIANVQNDKN